MTDSVSIAGMKMRVKRLGRGRPLLLLHGFTGAGSDFEHLFDLDALARRRELVIPDLRAHGGTDDRDGELTHRGCARDVLELLDALAIERCDAIGVSFGGNTLLHVATTAPARIESMVLVSATTHYPEQARAIMRASSDESRTAGEWALLRKTHGSDDRVRALLRHAREFGENRDDMRFTRDDLARIEARALIVNGDRDPLYPIEISVEMYRAIPRASLLVLPDAGHTPVFAEHRRAFVEAALAFVGAGSAS
jgi:pimeloyl-ACP methyl ester carboxylesterase